MSLVLVTAPAAEPVSLDEVKSHLRVTADTEDELIDALITAARQHVDGRDGWLGRGLVTQTWELGLDGFPTGWEYPSDPWPRATAIQVPLPPLQSVTSVKYIDPNGTEQTLASTEYVVHTAEEPGLIVLAYGKNWPSIRVEPGAVRVRFVAGYGLAKDVPRPIKLGLSAYVAHFYEHREPVILTGGVGSPVAIPMHVEALLQPYRMEWGF